MNLTLTEEQVELRTSLRRLFEDACPTALVREMKVSRDGVPTALWQTLQRTGLFGLAIDVEDGGEGASLFELGLLFEEAGRVLCPTVIYSTFQLAAALGHLGSVEQRKAHLGPLAAGELRGSVAISHPSDAGDVRPELVAQRSGEGWALSGTKTFVPNAGAADLVLVTARTTAYTEPSRVLGFLITPGGDSCTVEELTTMAGDKQARLIFRDHRVDPSQVLEATEADLRWSANAALALQCMEMVGGTAAVIDRTVAHITGREQFGRTIATFQAAQHHLANMRISLDMARLTAYQAIWWIARGEIAQREVAVATMHCSEAYKNATLTAHQLHGGMGFVRETDLHLWSERAKVTEIQGGTADVAARWLQVELGLGQR